MKTCLIFLHGSGGNGDEIRSFLEFAPVSQFNFSTFKHMIDGSLIDLFTPTAPLNFYSPSQVPMNVWFDRSKYFALEGLETKEHLSSTNVTFFFYDFIFMISES